MAKAKAKGKTGMIRARVDPGLKDSAETVLHKLGLSPSDAIRVFYRQIVLQKGLPFDLRIPNATTRKAIRELDTVNDLTRYATVDELLADVWEEEE